VQTGATLSELNGQLLLGLPSDDPEQTDRLFEEAGEAEAADDWERAALLYRRCLESEPSDPVVAFNLSHALLKSGEWREARRYLNKVLKLDPTYAEAWYNLASIARDQQDHEAAKRHLRKAIAADPGYPDPLYNLALLEFDAGDYDKATRLWQKYLDLDPKSAWGQKARYGLQLIGMITGRPGDASDIKAASEQLRVVR
jgi:tetratricopeptide (TPR) repeat protein